MPRVVVVGAGAAGTMAAIFAASAGAETLLARAHEGRRPQDPDQRRRTLQHPSRAARRIALRHRFVAAYCSAASCARGRSTSRSRSSSASCELPLVEETESGKLFPKSQSAREVRDRLLALRAPQRRARRHRHARYRMSAVGGRLDRRSPRQAIRSKPMRSILATGGLSVPNTGSDGRGLADRRAARTCGASDVRGADAAVDGTDHGAVSRICRASRSPSRSPRGRTRAEAQAHRADFCSRIRATAVRRCSTCRTSPSARSSEVATPAQRSPSNGRRWATASGRTRLRPRGSRTVLAAVSAALPHRLAEALVARSRHRARTAAGATWPSRAPAADRHARARAAAVDRRRRLQESRSHRRRRQSRGYRSRRRWKAARHKGLFLCGEMLDAFGPIGGYNFLWAWATGRAAGIGAAHACVLTRVAVALRSATRWSECYA